MPLPVLLPVLSAALCALAYLGLTARPPGLLRSAVKTAAVALLAVAALATRAPLALPLALGLCALGDLLLSRPGETAFRAGIGAFAAGHLAYVALFLGHAGADPARLVQSPHLWVTVALLSVGGAAAVLLAPRAGALRGPVLAYIPIILGMGLAALALPGAGRLWPVLPAALAFIASDLVLAVERFLLPPAHPALRVTPYAIWVLYWAAQVGFLAAFA